MKRRVYIICFLSRFSTGKKKVLDSDSGAIYVYPQDAIDSAKKKVQHLNKDKTLAPTYLCEGWLEVGKKVKVKTT